MGRIEKSIEVGAPPEKVWEMLALTILTLFGLVLTAVWQIVVGVKLYKLD